MTSDPINWNQEAELDPEKEYRALVRSIRYSRGFGLLFVQCSPAEGTRLIDRVREDLPTKKIDVLTLEESIDNLYDVVAALPSKEQIDVLFIQGVEHSLYEYEENQLWDEPSERYTYSKKGIPRILRNLNFGRERFAESFKFCFIFLVPLFVLKYLARRSPDFFDWRSGVLEFTSGADLVEKEYLRLLSEVSYEKYLSWTQSKRNRRILEIQSWNDEPKQSSKSRAALFMVQGILLTASQNYESAIASYEHSLKFEPNDSQAWIGRGDALLQLERYEEAVSSYDNALSLDLDNYYASLQRCTILLRLGRFEELECSYKRAFQLAPHDSNSWYMQGLILEYWGRELWGQTRQARLDALRQEGLIADGYEYDPDDDVEVSLEEIELFLAEWGADHEKVQTMVISKLNEAIKCFEKFLEIQHDNSDAYYHKSVCYALHRQNETAIVNSIIVNLETAISLAPEYRNRAKANPDFDSIRNDDRFQALINEHQNE